MGEAMELARRLSKYLYVSELISGRRVLEVGCGDGASADFLVQHGALEVIGVDRSEAAVRAGEARGLPIGVRLSVQSYRMLDLPERSIDLVLVPDGAEVLRGAGFLEEIRRVLKRDGALMFAAASADKAGARGGVHYHELTERLEPLFGPLRMAAQSAFGGWSLVEYDEAGGRLLEVALDASLVDRVGGEVAVDEYVALAGDHAAPRGYVVVQVPGGEPERATAVAAAGLGDAEAVLAELEAARSARSDAERRVRELGGDLEAARAALAEGEQRAQDLAQAVEAGNAAVAEARAAAARAREGGGEVARLREEAAAERRARDSMLQAAGEHARLVEELEGQLDESMRYAEELEKSLRVESERAAGLDKARAEAVRRADEAGAEARRLRSRVATLEGGELGRALGNGGAAAGVVAGAVPAAVAAVAAVAGSGTGTGTGDELAKANARWRAAEDKNDELWRKVGKAEQDAVETRENAARRAAEQKAVHAQALTRAMEEAGRKLASAQDETLRERRDAQALRSELLALRAEVARLRGESAGMSVELAAAREGEGEGEALRAALLAARDEAAASHSEQRLLRDGLAAARGELLPLREALAAARSEASAAREEAARHRALQQAPGAGDEVARQGEIMQLRAELEAARVQLGIEREASARRERQLVEDSVRLVAEAEERALAAEGWGKQSGGGSGAG